MRRFLSPKMIRWRLNRIANLPRGSHLYVMSDILDFNHFDPLKRDYRVWRYHDFPQLRSLIPSVTEEEGQDRSGADNFFLFSVELELMRRAPIEIHTEKQPWLTHNDKEEVYWLFNRLPTRDKEREIRRSLESLKNKLLRSLRNKLPR